jgi:uncharacterized flavoprotein (TIGR03862 family)
LKQVNVYGAGPAGLMAAETLASNGARVALHDHKRMPARKLLLAGRGGLNLTNAEPHGELVSRYNNTSPQLMKALESFPSDAVAEWSAKLGIEIFTGSSGRIFPRSMKASPLLRAWLQRLRELQVEFRLQSAWPGFDSAPSLLAFGGASWPELGSDAKWVSNFENAGIQVNTFTASNARHSIKWSKHFAEKFAGTPLKNIAVSHGGTRIEGEAMISRDGIEGSAVYALSQSIRSNPGAPLVIDLKPGLTDQQVLAKMLTSRKGDSRANTLRKAFNLPPVAISLMRETGAASVKRLELRTSGAHDLSRAISSAGGVDWSEINDDFSLKKHPGTFVAGEMIDWDAPTGGYLLQACLSTGYYAAKQLLQQL